MKYHDNANKNENIFMKDGEKLRLALINKGLTYSEAAKQMGKKSPSSIANQIEKEVISIKWKRELSDKLDIDIGVSRVNKPLKVKAGIKTENIVSVKQPKGNIEKSSMEATIGRAYGLGGEVKDFTVRGSSMEPNFYDGDMIRIIKVDVNEIKDNFCHVVKWDNGNQLSLKRITNRIDSRGEIILRSDNQEYNKPIHLNLSEIEEVYRIFCKVSFKFYRTDNFEERLQDLEIDMELVKKFINFE